MHIFPAIDLYDKKAVRLYKGDYDQMTVYSEKPVEVARDFEAAGAGYIHVVDLEGAKNGTTPNIDIVKEIVSSTGLFLEIGGGIRSMEVIEEYLGAGAGRVILGTAAVTDRVFLKKALAEFGGQIAVGVDIKDGKAAIKGWTESSELDAFSFMKELEGLGVKTVICTDISRDGAMRGTNLELYGTLSKNLSLDIIASGGVSKLKDIEDLKKMFLYGAIIGKAYYTGAIDLKEAIRAAAEEDRI